MSCARRLTVVTAAISLLVLASACTAGPATPTAGPVVQATVPVRVARAAQGTISATAIYSGNVQARSQVNVLPKVPGRIDRLNVDVGSVVKAGDVLAEIDPTLLRAQVAQAEAALALAETKLATIRDGPRPALVAQAEANARAASEKVASLEEAARAETIAQAEANVRLAEAKLDQLKKGPTPEQIAAAKLQIDQARNNLWMVQTTRDGICGNARIPAFQCDAAKAQVGTAETAIKQAEAQLAVLTSPPTVELLAQAQAGVDVAKQQLELARSPINSHDLAQAQAAADAAARAADLARQPYTDNDRAAAQAGVDQARAALDAARSQLRDATITAPFDGVVAARLLAQGALASSATPIATLLSTDLEVVVNVEEARLRQVAVGQAATISVAAYPGDESPAAVSAIAPSLDPRSRTVAVRIRPAGQGKLLDGMFAQVKLTGDARAPALLVPAQAVIQKDGRAVVFTVADGRAASREVQVGAGDGRLVEVASGLSDGDAVVVSGQESLTDGQAVTVQG